MPHHLPSKLPVNRQPTCRRATKPSPATKQPPFPAKSEKPTTRATAAAPPVADPFAQKVQAAIARGRSFLAGAQNPDGSFVFRNSEAGPLVFAPGARPQETGNSPRYAIGATSLAVLALLNAGEKPDAPVITKGLDFLRQAPTTATYFSTYETSLEIAALVAAKTGDRDRGRITALAQSLEKDQLRRGSLAGLWNYGVRDKAGAGDNSNTQFALYGLYAAARAGIPVRRETWDRSSDHFVELQNTDGGWGYQNHNPSTGSMTCGAIASLALCDQMLVASRPPDGQITPGDGDEKKVRREIALKRGIGWMSRYFRIDTNPGQGGTWTLYYLFEMSRAGRLSGHAIFGRHDWYHEGASYLIDGQSLHDGSWQTSWGVPESDKIVATSFALLFLSAASSGEPAIKVNDAPPHERTSLPSEGVAAQAAKRFVGAKADRQLESRFESLRRQALPGAPAQGSHLSGRATNQKHASRSPGRRFTSWRTIDMKYPSPSWQLSSRARRRTLRLAGTAPPSAGVSAAAGPAHDRRKFSGRRHGSRLWLHVAAVDDVPTRASAG